MTTTEIVIEVQKLLGVEPDGWPGKITHDAFERICNSALAAKTAKRWPFAVTVDGEDLLLTNIVITCFGGAFDPQDNGNTASGINTKRHPETQGVSVAMDGRSFPSLSSREHAALDFAPIPRIPFGTLVAVTINGKTLTLKDGIIDLGPGLQATQIPSEPHGLDLSEGAAALFAPNMPKDKLSRQFEMRGDARIFGAAKYLKT